MKERKQRREQVESQEARIEGFSSDRNMLTTNSNGIVVLSHDTALSCHIGIRDLLWIRCKVDLRNRTGIYFTISYFGGEEGGEHAAQSRSKRFMLETC